MKNAYVLSVLITACLADLTLYDRYKVYQITPTTIQHTNILKLFRKSNDFDFWTESRVLGSSVNIMVSPRMQHMFTKVLQMFKIRYITLIEDVESVFAEERNRERAAPKVQKGRISFESYHRYDIIQDYIQQIANDHPDLARVEIFATSTEGRPIRVIRIGDNPNNPSIIIDGGIHAREWIAPAVVLYIIQQLVENEEYRYLSEKINWVIIPVLNPDGYEYTHTTNRLWRKTRSPGTSCYGVDANRNFDFEWGGEGTSTNECSDIYAGPYAFSEPEVAGFAQLISSIENIALYLAIHSYGQWIIYPWGYTVAVPDNAAEHQNLGVLVAESIRAVDGTEYVVGNSAELLYPAAGCSDDWMLARGGAPLSYTVELPGGGSAGFDLPASRIVPVVEETWEGILTYINYVIAERK